MKTPFKQIITFIREIFLIPVHLYRIVISPILPPSCIYSPSCSAYVVESIRKHGIMKGTILGCARILRCHGLFMGGFDPVPEHFTRKTITTPYRVFFKKREK